MKNYLIISASSDVGLASAKILKENGANLFITARSEEKLSQLKNELSCDGATLDATNFEAVENVFKNAIEKLGSIDAVACFAGSVLLKPAHLVSNQEYFDTINASLTTAFAVSRACGKFMKNGGSVLLMSSAAAIAGIANHEAIAAAKGGVNALVKSAAATYASQNLRFNAIALGLTDTKLTKKIVENEASLKFSKAMHALNRIGTKEDAAEMAAFLLSEKASFITGQIIAIDGGLSCLQPKIKLQ